MTMAILDNVVHIQIRLGVLDDRELEGSEDRRGTTVGARTNGEEEGAGAGVGTPGGGGGGVGIAPPRGGGGGGDGTATGELDMARSDAKEAERSS